MAAENGESAQEVARRIEDRLARAGLTRRDLAARTGIPFATVNRKLDAPHELTFAELHLIAASLGTTPLAFIPSGDRAAQP